MMMMMLAYRSTAIRHILLLYFGSRQCGLSINYFSVTVTVNVIMYILQLVQVSAFHRCGQDELLVSSVIFTTLSSFRRSAIRLDSNWTSKSATVRYGLGLLITKMWDRQRIA